MSNLTQTTEKRKFTPFELKAIERFRIQMEKHGSEFFREGFFEVIYALTKLKKPLPEESFTMRVFWDAFKNQNEIPSPDIIFDWCTPVSLREDIVRIMISLSTELEDSDDLEHHLGVCMPVLESLYSTVKEGGPNE